MYISHLLAILHLPMHHSIYFFLTHKNGDIRWWFIDAVKLSDHQFIGFVKDITESKQAAEEIKKSNERFELIARATNDGLWDSKTA